MAYSNQSWYGNGEIMTALFLYGKDGKISLNLSPSNRNSIKELELLKFLHYYT